MPPSPALRCSPGRELRGDNHKRGRSFESGLLLKEKDDDLALFNEMQTKEKESFLLQSTDDFDDTFSTKLRYFSDFKLGISIPVQGESSELLNADGEKNDYDWLLTPPDTPLFPSLDDEPAQSNVSHRGRPRSQPISISRSSTMEKSYRSSRGSASPNRLSPSPRSGTSSFQSTRGRPSSAPQSSPTRAPRSATPTRRPSTPPCKPSTPVPRSSTPTPRRTSAGSGGSAASSSVRGTSPIRTSRGNSASPKIRAWQSNIPGFSLEAPPNLRTSLADRPASYVRGSSPASRNGRDSKFGRQSMSPTTSRSISSSHSHDRDRFSPHSKGSVASSGDDDMDSLQSIPIGGSDYSVSKRVGAFPNNRAPAFSKKSARILSSSAPKRSSFDSALRQMNHQRSPQNMFRPLLSSVPSSTFYVGKGSSNHRSVISLNSSVTTSSHASSDLGTSVAHETEGNDHHQDDVTSDCVRVLHIDVQEVFAFDKVDALDEGIEHERHEKSSDLQLGVLDTDPSTKCGPDPFEVCRNNGTDVEIDPTSNTLSVRVDSSEVDYSDNTRLCSQCGIRYRVIESVEEDINLCPDCRKQNDVVTFTNPGTTIVVGENSSVLSVKISEDNKQFDELKPSIVIPELQSQAFDMVETRLCEPEEKVVQSQKYSQENSLARSPSEGGEQRLNYPQEMGQPNVGYDPSDKDTVSQQLQLSSDIIDMKVDNSEGAGISLLLKRSNSSKGPVLQSRTFTATSIPYEDLSYARDSANSLRSSIGHGSGSASSSIDFSSSRQSETRVQRQLSGRKSDLENYRNDVNIKPQSIGSSLPGNSNHTHQAFGLARNAHENSEVSVGDTKHDVEGCLVTSQFEVFASENKESDGTNVSFTDAAVLDEGIFEHNESSRTMDASTSDLSSHTASIQSDQNSVASCSNYEDRASYGNGDDIPKIVRSAFDVEESVITPESSYKEEHSMLGACPAGMDDAEVPARSPLATITEIELENNCQSRSSSQMGDVFPKSTSIVNEFSNKDIIAVPDSNTSDHAHGILEDSTVLVKCRGGSKSRSLTLEEATEAILFCSSIVHDIAYQAATIAMEKESPAPLEGSRPTVTILGKSSSDKKNPRGRTLGKQASKSQKARQRRVETNSKPAIAETENDENADESKMQNVGLPYKGDSLKPPKLESKCNCTIM